MSDWPFSHADRVRYADVDTMRHLNNVAFVQFFEDARIAFMHSLFPEHDPTDPDEFPVEFAELHLAYRAPAYFGEVRRIEIGANRQPAGMVSSEGTWPSIAASGLPRSSARGIAANSASV